MGLRNVMHRAETAVEDASATVRLSAAVSVAALIIAAVALIVAVRR
jgi:hypothetical protein